MGGQSWLSQQSNIKHAWCVLLFNWSWNINIAGIHWLTFDWRERERERERETEREKEKVKERETREGRVGCDVVSVSVSCCCVSWHVCVLYFLLWWLAADTLAVEGDWQMLMIWLQLQFMLATMIASYCAFTLRATWLMHCSVLTDCGRCEKLRLHQCCVLQPWSFHTAYVLV